MADDALPSVAARDRSIGVGMGGSCPDCRSPVDLGQEFCLECGSSTRVPADAGKRPKKAQATAPGVPAAPPGGGFPWVPFLIILGLIGMGLLYALVGGSSSPTASKKEGTTTQGGVSSLSTNSQLPTVQTVTVPGCNSGATTAAPQPYGTPTTPTTPMNTATSGDATSVLPTPAAGSTVTVDERGMSCPATTAPGVTPTTTQATTPQTTTSGSSSGSLGQFWPAGKSGFTVQLNAYPQASYSEPYAQQQAARAQENSIAAGVINSNQYSSLKADIWVVFHGVYDTEAAATAELPKVRDAYPSAVVREVRP